MSYLLSAPSSLVRQQAMTAAGILPTECPMTEEIGRLREAVNMLTKRKTRKRRYISAEETLTVGEVSNLIAEKEGGSRKDGETPAKNFYLTVAGVMSNLAATAAARLCVHPLRRRLAVLTTTTFLFSN
jgi:hypothetical protein